MPLINIGIVHKMAKKNFYYATFWLLIPSRNLMYFHEKFEILFRSERFAGHVFYFKPYGNTIFRTRFYKTRKCFKENTNFQTLPRIQRHRYGFLPKEIGHVLRNTPLVSEKHETLTIENYWRLPCVDNPSNHNRIIIGLCKLVSKSLIPVSEKFKPKLHPTLPTCERKC